MKTKICYLILFIFIIIIKYGLALTAPLPALVSQKYMKYNDIQEVTKIGNKCQKAYVCVRVYVYELCYLCYFIYKYIYYIE